MKSQNASQLRASFRNLHEAGCFVLPNPWDVGGAKLCAEQGFKALGTTSAGFAWSRGRADGGMSRDETLEHFRVMARATNLPVHGDFESGFGDTAEDVFDSVSLALETGIAGISIEDSTGDHRKPLREIEESVERIAAARAAIDAAGGDAMLTGRAENFFVGSLDLNDTIRRLEAYANAGADCLYAPGIKTYEEISAVLSAFAPKPVNILIGWDSEFTLQDLADLGVRRVSLGGGLARAAWGAVLRSVRAIAEEGRFTGFSGAPSGVELNSIMKSRRR